MLSPEIIYSPYEVIDVRCIYILCKKVLHSQWLDYPLRTISENRLHLENCFHMPHGNATQQFSSINSSTFESLDFPAAPGRESLLISVYCSSSGQPCAGHRVESFKVTQRYVTLSWLEIHNTKPLICLKFLMILSYTQQLEFFFNIAHHR